MLSEKMNEAINKQIQEELFSAYIYFSMANWFASQSLNGMATWMKAQTMEELFHMSKMQDYVIERGGSVTFEAVAKPQGEWKSPLDVFETAYHHECHISACINNLMNIAMDERDHATTGMLRWFVDEQVEEEASADEIVQKLKMIGDFNHGIFMIDKELSLRTPTWPAVAGE
jgi:ferritin